MVRSAIPRMIPISPADLPRADHSRHWYCEETAPRRRPCDQSSRTVLHAHGRTLRLIAGSRRARQARARNQFEARQLQSSPRRLPPLSSRIGNVNPQRMPNFSASLNRARFRLRAISHFKSRPPSEGLRLAYCPTYHRIDGFVAALQIDGGPGGGYVEIRLGALPGSRRRARYAKHDSLSAAATPAMLC